MIRSLHSVRTGKWSVQKPLKHRKLFARNGCMLDARNPTWLGNLIPSEQLNIEPNRTI